MSNINIKILLKEIYPIDFFKKFEAIEIIIKEIKGNEEQQKFPYKQPFIFNFGVVRKDLKFEIKFIHGVTIIACDTIKISNLKLKEKYEVGDILLSTDIKNSIKKKVFGNIPYCCIRLKFHYYITYSDAPFNCGHIYKSTSPKTITDLNKIKLKKQSNLLKWPNEKIPTFLDYFNKIDIIPSKGVIKVKKAEKKMKMDFYRSNISECPKKATKKEIEDVNYQQYSENNKKKLKDLCAKIYSILFPKESVVSKKKESNGFVVFRNKREIVSNKLNDISKSIISEFYSNEIEYNDLYKPDDDFFNILNYENQIRENMTILGNYLDPNKDYTSQDLKFLINMFSEQHEIYEKAKLIVSSKNIFFKIRLSFYIDHLEKMENLLSEYKLLNNTLNFNKFSTGINRLRSENISVIENNLFKKLKLIKYFRITYDNENHINNSKKLLEGIIMNIAKDQYNSDLISNKAKVLLVRFFH